MELCFSLARSGILHTAHRFFLAHLYKVQGAIVGFTQTAA